MKHTGMKVTVVFAVVFAVVSFVTAAQATTSITHPNQLAKIGRDYRHVDQGDCVAHIFVATTEISLNAQRGTMINQATGLRITTASAGMEVKIYFRDVERPDTKIHSLMPYIITTGVKVNPTSQKTAVRRATQAQPQVKRATQGKTETQKVRRATQGRKTTATATTTVTRSSSTKTAKVRYIKSAKKLDQVLKRQTVSGKRITGRLTQSIKILKDQDFEVVGYSRGQVVPAGQHVTIILK